MRIGLMGGTFDPIHLGHLRAAEEIYWAFDLDRIVFVPAARPPHKSEEAIEASALQRYEMVSLATIHTPYFAVSPIELRRPGHSYSIETVREFRRVYGEESRIYFIMGVDAFQGIATWKEPQELLATAQVIVTARPGWRLDQVERTVTAEQQRVIGDLRFKYLKVSEISGAVARERYEPRLVLLVEVVSLDISSSEIRQLARRGRSIRFLVPDAVAAYVAKHRLYQGATGRAEGRD
jgi:nicotinate-nucleotide adenylyltransferase